MTNNSRDQIFARLHAVSGQISEHVPETVCMPIETLSQSEKIEKLKNLMEAVRSEVHIVDRSTWPQQLKKILKARDVKSLLFAPETPIGDRLESEGRETSNELPELIAYQDDIEEFKERLFEIDAGITSTIGAIAETGALILWPTVKEPRLMSLVPPIHIAVLEAEKIHNTFCEVIQKENWPGNMPTNVVLISGPSKTADIELTLAFGVHGPKELIVLILKD